mmetsp:Transcript_17506/g.27056  ORF Transcript_17506/g.27056 Transcript_17506/m.27056 type:complete len:124 (-) Transcript_17506:379-750(-)
MNNVDLLKRKFGEEDVKHKATNGVNNKLCNAHACYLQYKEQNTQTLTETTVFNEPLHTSKKHDNTPNYVIWPVYGLEKLILNDSHCPSSKGKSKTNMRCLVERRELVNYSKNNKLLHQSSYSC